MSLAEIFIKLPPVDYCYLDDIASRMPSASGYALGATATEASTLISRLASLQKTIDPRGAEELLDEARGLVVSTLVEYGRLGSQVERLTQELGALGTPFAVLNDCLRSQIESSVEYDSSFSRNIASALELAAMTDNRSGASAWKRGLSLKGGTRLPTPHSIWNHYDPFRQAIRRQEPPLPPLDLAR
jgi:hypothetical protein